MSKLLQRCRVGDKTLQVGMSCLHTKCSELQEPRVQETAIACNKEVLGRSNLPADLLELSHETVQHVPQESLR